MAAADKWMVARALDEIARYLELSETNPFKARAFQRAARGIENLEAELGEVIAAGQLTSTPGVGKAIGPIVVELVESGRSTYLEELRQQYPPGIFDLLRVPGLGLKKIGQLFEAQGIASLDDLEAAARENRLAKLKGFGAKTQAKIVAGVAVARRRESMFLLPAGLEVGEAMRERIAAIPGVADVEVVGSVRRRMEVVRNVNIAVATSEIESTTAALQRLVDRFEEIDASTFRGVARNEFAVWFHLSSPEDFAATVLRTTGSSDFVEGFARKAEEAGFELSEGAFRRNGRRLKVRTESELFDRLDVPFVEPERREDGDELRRRKRTALVEPSQIRGTFHVHTTYSDGRNSVEEMLTASRDRGLDYVGISDHSPAAYYARGLTVAQVVEQQSEIARQEPAMAPMRIFRGTEADILPDGTIDYGPRDLQRFDFVVASVHSRFGMPEDEMTERILKALDDPHVTFLGHLTGRLLLSRDGYAVDFDRIFDRAAERGVILEINGNPHRLDVDWRHLRRAVDRGVVFSVHPDAHSIAEMSHVISGTWVARKGGLSAKEIFNTRPVEDVEAHLAARKKRAMGAC